MKNNTTYLRNHEVIPSWVNDGHLKQLLIPKKSFEINLDAANEKVWSFLKYDEWLRNVLHHQHQYPI